MRLDKMLSNLKYGSRKDVKKIISKGLVFVNDKQILKDDFEVNEFDKIVVDGSEVYYDPNLVIMINKPQNYICSNQDELYPSILNLLEDKYRRLDLNVAGRLDYDTEGLVILTNNGDLNHKIISPNKKVNKTYLVKTLKEIDDKMLNTLRHDIPLKDKKGEFYIAKSIDVKVIDKNTLELIIDEGKFHQVKNMIAYSGNEVVYLKRIKIGSLELGNLEAGEYVKLNENQVLSLLKND